ncbi:Gfo/Idh/MocA family oxidoreductase [Paeniglutamicibacter cryotolerans]|uniref:Myo-inositol 2-dehydrogenase/D-chiro-inositol 1-dehydrogenase n=1 Tax=Paeniglutamicibacter cryotolerans TaxID=670079 RepID=A0A839QQC1_9MICC|nr:Gfo/Idh/MocA family oxidoreductase [Paeniglutamicibacter cryotolerans]MBB2995452.1 myo-inositol 2-dehydrogenase/D-chiro-inositol 1-dehydrogenase [Paeniglutamicibacter cryotolerans]
MTIRVGVIGVGIMGADHARNIAHNIGGASLAGVADIDAACAAEHSYGGFITVDALELIGHPDVDAVIIASHDSTHAELVLAAMAADKPVLCEKPLARNAADSRRIVEADLEVRARTGKSLLGVGFMRRFDPGHVRLRRTIEEGELGRVLMVHCISRNVSSAPGTSNESAIMNSAIHELDSVAWMIGSPIAEVAWIPVGAGSVHAAGSFQDPAFMMLRTASGVLATLELYLNARHGYSTQCEVVCEEGTVSLREPAEVEFNEGGKNFVEYPADWRPRFAEAYRNELQAWIHAIADGTGNPLASGQDGLNAALVGEAMVESMRRGGAFVSVQGALVG